MFLQFYRPILYFDGTTIKCSSFIYYDQALTVREGYTYQAPLWFHPTISGVLIFWGGTYGFSEYLMGKENYPSGNYSGVRPDVRITAC